MNSYKFKSSGPIPEIPPDAKNVHICDLPIGAYNIKTSVNWDEKTYELEYELDSYLVPTFSFGIGYQIT